MGPQTEFARFLHSQKYQHDGESFEESKNRIAATLCPNPAHYRHFRDLLLDQRVLVGGRIASNLGRGVQCTALNCFHLPSVQDSFTEGPDNIMSICTDAAITLRSGGGIGTNWSNLRPRGDLITKLGARASGPVAFLPIIDGVCKATASAGHRRGAQLVSLRIDHPDIEEFIHCKTDQYSLTSMNISVLVTNEFFSALQADTTFPLRFNGKVYKEVRATALWESIMRNAWDHAEPGVIFIDEMNNQNPLQYAEEILGTNVCGEIPLPANGCCLLASINLTKYIKESRLGRFFDFNALETDVPTLLRAIDNVIETSMYPLEAQHQEMLNKRRIGVGVTGLANAVEALHPDNAYGSKQFIGQTQAIMSCLRNVLYATSAELAHEKGIFPLFDWHNHVKSEFIQRLPSHIYKSIRKHGLRNSHLLAIAPTGTISLTADNVSSGIEPVRP